MRLETGRMALRSAMKHLDLVGDDYKGLEDNLYRWYENKDDLYWKFRKHPGWNERALAVIGEIAIEVPFEGEKGIFSQDVYRPFVLSLNPADYLLMSHGNSWTDWHSWPNGQSRAGTLSMMGDPSTVVAYVVRNIPIEDMARLPQEPKRNRQLAFVEGSGKLFVVGKMVPEPDKDAIRFVHDYRKDFRTEMEVAFRRKIQGILVEAFDFPDLWRAPLAGSQGITTARDQLVYDGICTSLSTTSVADVAYDDFEDGYYKGTVSIGGDIACVKCGRRTEIEFHGFQICKACRDLRNQIPAHAMEGR